MVDHSPAASPSRSPKKKRAAKAKKIGPTVRDLIVKAVAASKQRGGVSLAALKKSLKASGYDVEKNKARIKVAVKGLVAKGTLVHTKGTGASGSFKMSKKVVEKKKKRKPAKKRAAPKAKKPKAKRAKAKRARKSPKKAKKPAAKRAKSPKKAKKRAAPKRAKSPRRGKTAKRKAHKPKRAAPKKK
ncbi:hypothetical protein JZ751_000191 [Albula glossodonta]|uniref:Histone H1 n=1 Tax=Albula glossodonta TaxID=121402 RepID=A0A8T2PVJ0_9TELE|nr:hypothetical protein JZ751_000191 [Albula glossodonta]